MKIPKQNSILSGNLFILNIVWKSSPMRIFLQLLDDMLSNLMNIFYSIVFFQIILNQVSYNASIERIFKIIVVMLLLNFFITIYSNWFNNLYIRKSNTAILEYLNLNFLSKIKEYDIECYEDATFYDNYTKASSEANTRVFNILDTFSTILTNILGSIVIIFIIATLDFASIMIAIVPMFVVIILDKILNKINYNYDMENIPAMRKFDYIKRVVYLADFAKEFRLTNISNVIFKKFDEAVEDRKNLINKYTLKRSLLVFLWNTVSNNIITFLAYTYATIRLIITKTLVLGDFVALGNSINTFAWNLFSLSRSLMDIDKNNLYIQNLIEFLKYEPKIKNNDKSINVLSNKISLEVKNMSFKYKNQIENNLNNISFYIHQGEKVAIVGYNGAGKSTFIKVLLRLYEVDTGEIRLNNINIKDYDLDFYRDQFSVVFQDFKIYAASISENVLMDNYVDNKKQTIVDSLRKGGIYQKVSSLDNDIYALLTKEFSEEGEILSQGEYQKIAISRLFARNCKIAILDEPTSSLDPKSEYELFTNVFQNFETLIFVSHKLLGTINADRIYVMQNGQFCEVGTHDDLMNLKGLYYEMFTKQTENY